ncbi:MAG: phosphate/phosphite/phosphonate ABC transporter substrate-binding protein [Nitriliruptoraceae bacterium]
MRITRVLALTLALPLLLLAACASEDPTADAPADDAADTADPNDPTEDPAEDATQDAAEDAAETATQTEQAPAEDDEPLVFAFPPGAEDPEQLDLIQPVADLVGEITDREVETQIPADYLGVVEALRNGFVDVAVLSPFATAIGRASADLDIVLAWEAGDADLPASAIVVRADSDITTLEDLRGRNVAFVDAGSSTGHFMPRGYLVEQGLVADEDYEFTFAGGHDSALFGVLQGSVDAAGIGYLVLDLLEDADVFDPDQVRIIGESGPIPVGGVTMIVRDGLDADLRQTIIDELPARGAEIEELDLLFGTPAIREPGDEVFAPLTAVMESVGVSLDDVR